MANVSIVIVSHSRDLGEGLVRLLCQLSGDEVVIRHAAGLGDEIGTDATFIMQVLSECPVESEILVFFDLGSAFMNTEMALELLPEDVRLRVHILDAPLVEGAVVAAVAARGQLPCDVVIEQAVQARVTKKVLD